MSPLSSSQAAREILSRLETDRFLGVDFCPLSADRLLLALDEASPDVSDELAALAVRVSACQECPLGRGRRLAVFGEGASKADLVFVGEGPGADEDRAGRPFVGRSGQLLTKIIAAMGFDREQVYITSVVKCRPPGNRTPSPEEAAACRPYLDRQLALIGPKVVVALGAAATKTLLDKPGGITSLRGRFYDMGGLRVMPTFHPAYLLRNPQQKAKVWHDMKLVLSALGAPVPNPSPTR
jgi:DNA polymerase